MKGFINARRLTKSCKLTFKGFVNACYRENTAGKTQKFSINIPNTELLEKIKYCGSVSGMEKDKSQVFDVFYGKNDVPIITKCPVNMNCEIYETIDTKDMLIFIGQVME